MLVSGGKKAARPVIQKFKTIALERKQVVKALAEDGSVSLVSHGRALPDQRIVIADPESLILCPPDRVGEIWVSGPGVAQGYWNRREETVDAFRAYLTDTEEGPFLRTGDLGFTHDGELFVTGRSKDLIIIRGRNIYPQDIETTVERAHPSIRPGCVAATSIEEGDSVKLVIIAEVERRHQPDRRLRPGAVHDDRRSGVERRHVTPDPHVPDSPVKFDPDAVVTAIRNAVAERHELNIHAMALIVPKTIPKTSSGKIQRRLSLKRYLAGQLKVLVKYPKDEPTD